MIMSYLPQTTEKKNKVLTEKQQSFLDNLIQTGGDPKKAAELAGYSGNYHQVIKALKQEVIELASDVLARSAPQAAFKLVDIMNSNIGKEDRPIQLSYNRETEEIETTRRLTGIFKLKQRYMIKII